MNQPVLHMGIINGCLGYIGGHQFTYFGGDQTMLKYMVILRDFPYNGALFGLVI